eukprot:gene3668-4185_t
MTVEKEEKCELTYVSTGCNRALHCLAWGRNDLIAFGATNSIAIYSPKERSGAGRIRHLLNKHTGRVVCAHWLSSKSGIESELASGSSDKSICVWKVKDDNWMLCQQLQGHKDVVCALSSLDYLNNEQKETNILVSSSADSSVIIWKRISADHSEFAAMQTLSLGNGFALSLALTKLPGTESPLLACGCDDTKIHLFAEKSEHFEKLQVVKGHEDWIQSMDFSHSDDSFVYLASGSKDCYIRIWKISSQNKQGKCDDELQLEEQKLHLGEKEYSVVLESVLAGHEGWVNGVQWKRSFQQDGKTTQPMTILSASMDKTMMLWELDSNTGVWLDTARMGDVGGNTLGFYGCAISPDGNSVIAHGFQGAFHLWSVNSTQVHDSWTPGVTISGHFGAVQDFDWEPENGEFLISVGTDQTARLHAPWIRKNNPVTWHEIARPQVHGYDMQCIACVSRSTYASGSEEKVTRIFQAPKSFFDSFSEISQIRSAGQVNAALPIGASVPSLGLSNKAVFQNDLETWKEDGDDKSRPQKASAFASEDPAPYTPLAITHPPPEDVLLQNTLWPEVHKLYGHGFEIFCLACSPQGTVLASACKASKAEHANIILWDTKTWRQIGNLVAHSLTVTQLSFSHSGDWLLSVSRDRTWALYNKVSADDGCSSSPYVLTQKTDKKTGVHSRIIWSCCWTPDDKYFATASRDKQVIIWCQSSSSSEKQWGPAGKSLDVGESCTAISCLPSVLESQRYVFAVGLESGNLELHSWNPIDANWDVLLKLDKALCPTLAVKRLRWNRHRIPIDDSHDFAYQLGACSSDSSLRVLSIPLSVLRTNDLNVTR